MYYKPNSCAYFAALLKKNVRRVNIFAYLCILLFIIKDTYNQ